MGLKYVIKFEFCNILNIKSYNTDLIYKFFTKNKILKNKSCFIKWVQPKNIYIGYGIYISNYFHRYKRFTFYTSPNKFTFYA